jgi:hypothetical protein
VALVVRTRYRCATDGFRGEGYTAFLRLIQQFAGKRPGLPRRPRRLGPAAPGPHPGPLRPHLHRLGRGPRLLRPRQPLHLVLRRGQLAYLLESPAGSLLVSASAGYWRAIFEPLRPDVAILGATGRPVLDGEPYQGSLAGFLAEEAALLGHPRSSSGTTTPSCRPDRRHRHHRRRNPAQRNPGQVYRRLEYGAPTAILSKRP